MRRILVTRARLLAIILFATILLLPSSGACQNATLQIHFINVGQGDGALLISPGGTTMLFDDGVKGQCGRVVSYLLGLGITKIDYHVTSHYHQDHIGCATEVLTQFPLQTAAFDRGGSYNSGPYRDYVDKVGAKRRTATDGQVITLDTASTTPVTIRIIALNGNGISTTNENDLSLVALVKFGDFEAVIGGDLSGYDTGSYEDIETSVAPKVGQVEVYKVHHHCSQYSTNSTWLDITQPRVGVISAGNGNGYGHPRPECIERLHNAGVKTYWTETGDGLVAPEAGLDVVAGSVVVEMAAGAQQFSVKYGAQAETYSLWGTAAGGGTPTTTPRYSWSKNSNVYHYSECKTVLTIKPENLQRGDTTPSGKTLHQVCPVQ